MPVERVPSRPTDKRAARWTPRILLTIGRLLKGTPSTRWPSSQPEFVAPALSRGPNRVREWSPGQVKERNKARFQRATSIVQTTLAFLPSFSTGAQTGWLRSFPAT